MSQPLRLWCSSRAAPAPDQHSPTWGACPCARQLVLGAEPLPCLAGVKSAGSSAGSARRSSTT